MHALLKNMHFLYSAELESLTGTIIRMCNIGQQENLYTGPLDTGRATDPTPGCRNGNYRADVGRGQPSIVIQLYLSRIKGKHIHKTTPHCRSSKSYPRLQS